MVTYIPTDSASIQESELRQLMLRDAAILCARVTPPSLATDDLAPGLNGRAREIAVRRSIRKPRGRRS